MSERKKSAYGEIMKECIEIGQEKLSKSYHANEIRRKIFDAKNDIDVFKLNISEVCFVLFGFWFFLIWILLLIWFVVNLNAKHIDLAMGSILALAVIAPISYRFFFPQISTGVLVICFYIAMLFCSPIYYIDNIFGISAESRDKKRLKAKQKEQQRIKAILENLTPEQKEGKGMIDMLFDWYKSTDRKFVDIIKEMEEDNIRFKTYYDAYIYLENKIVKKHNLPKECRNS